MTIIQRHYFERTSEIIIPTSRLQMKNSNLLLVRGYLLVGALM